MNFPTHPHLHGGGSPWFTDNFEFGQVSAWAYEGQENAPTIITDPTNGRNKVLNSEISRPAAPYNSGNSRSELRFDGESLKDRYLPWFSKVSLQYRMYTHPDHDFNGNHQNIFSQLHGPPKCNIVNPCMALYIQDNYMNLVCRGQQNYHVGSNTKNEYATWADSTHGIYTTNGIYTLTKGQWYYFVIDMTYDYRLNDDGGAGLVKIYINQGSAPNATHLRLEHNQQMGYHEELSMYMKLGIYAFPWRKQQNIDKDLKDGFEKFKMLFDDVVWDKQHKLARQ